MERRNFLTLSALGLSAGIIAPSSILASGSHKESSNKAGGVYYTKDFPGRWVKKVGGHLPQISKSGGKIKVSTPHAMNGYKHYIVKHTILDDNFEFIDEKMFDPIVDKSPISSFDLGKYKGRIYVLSMCNKHDVWMSSTSL